MKLEQTIPKIEPEALFDLISNVKNRMKWDERWIDGSIVEEKPDGSLVIYYLTPKPPVPLMSSK